MKIGKRTISFTGDKEIDDLKVAMMWAATTSMTWLRGTAEDPISCLKIHLMENKNNLEDAIADMFATVCQEYRIIEYYRILHLSEELTPCTKRDMRIAKKDFETIRRFCKNDVLKLNMKL
jgi:hypothetical protein